MAKKITLSLDPRSIDNAMRQITQLEQNTKTKVRSYLQKLADRGLQTARAEMSGHVFTGETINSLRVEEIAGTGGSGFVLKAESKAILYFEFGTGVRHSAQQHPKAAELGMGPGTHSEKGHWDDPNGWWFPTDDARLIKKIDANGQGWGHTYGNPPYMPMYKSSQEIIRIARQVAMEVFA